MKVRFGYVANVMDIMDCSPSKTVTVSNLLKIGDPDDRIMKLRKTAEENLKNTLRILKYNEAHDIKIYRFTSKLVPLATHDAAEGWDYISDLKESFVEVGDFVKKNGMRVSSHPDHFTLLNSPREEVLISSLKDLQYHARVFDACGFDDKAKMVLHVGGLYGDRNSSIDRFIKNFREIGTYLQKRIILENDDKVYTAVEVLRICQTLGIPMVLDVHHDKCNPCGSDIGEYIEYIFKTWEGQDMPPKIHFSSPRSEKDMRSHAGYIDAAYFLDFLNKAAVIDMDFDVMIEAKQKNLALYKLMDDLKVVEGIEIVNGAEISVLKTGFGYRFSE